MTPTPNNDATRTHMPAGSKCPPTNDVTADVSPNPIAPTLSQANPPADAVTHPQPVGPPADTATIAPTVPPMVAESAPFFELPGYRITGVLGRGGMGVVYDAVQVKLNRRVAVKMVLAGEHASSDAFRRFQAEAEAIAKLPHPNVVQVFEVGEHRGQPYLVLEYLPGGSLADRLRNGVPPPDDSARLVESIARA